MLIYILLLVTILVLNTLRKNRQVSDRAFCVVICSLFVLITGLRHNMVGSDTTGYYLGFYRIANSSLSEIIALKKRDFGFYIFEWLVANIFHDFAAVTFIAACVFYIPVTLLIYRYSDDYGMSYLILMAFMFFQFSMTGIRQTMALGFALMFVLEILKKRKNCLRIAVYVTLGITMHRSCVAILPFILLYVFRKNRFIAHACLVLLPVVFVFRGAITNMALSLFQTVGFDLGGYVGNSGGVTTFLVYLLLFIWGVFFTSSGENRCELPPLLLSLMGISAVLQTFVFVNSIFFRVVWYYSIFMVIYIPKMLTASKVDRNVLTLMRFVVYAGLLYMYLGITIGSANVLPYRFFWQGV